MVVSGQLKGWLKVPALKQSASWPLIGRGLFSWLQGGSQGLGETVQQSVRHTSVQSSQGLSEWSSVVFYPDH